LPFDSHKALALRATKCVGLDVCGDPKDGRAIGTSGFDGFGHIGTSPW
jgi:hypothetical protein